MLFDVHPKTSITELFGRRAEYLSFIEAVEKRRNFFIITGPRRMGKRAFSMPASMSLKKNMEFHMQWWMQGPQLPSTPSIHRGS